MLHSYTVGGDKGVAMAEWLECSLLQFFKTISIHLAGIRCMALFRARKEEGGEK